MKILCGSSVIDDSNFYKNFDALSAEKERMCMKTVFSVSGVLAEELDNNCGMDLVGKSILLEGYGCSVKVFVKGNTWRELWKTFEEAYEKLPRSNHVFFEGIGFRKNASKEFETLLVSGS